MAVMSVDLGAACGPLLWALVQQLNSPLLRAVIICGTIFLSHTAVWITTPRLTASFHMMNVKIHPLSGIFDPSMQ